MLEKLAAGDPGVRCLYTIYDPGRSAYIRIGFGWSSYMDRCVYRTGQPLSHHGRLTNSRKPTTQPTRLNQKQELERASERAQAGKQERAMEDIAFLLLSSYDVMILPKLGGQGS